MSAVERVIQNNISSSDLIPVRQVENELRQLIGHEVSPREAQIVHSILFRERTASIGNSSKNFKMAR
jgi:hypothetical protein